MMWGHLGSSCSCHHDSCWGAAVGVAVLVAVFDVVWADDFDALAREEPDVESPLATPPNRLFGVGHIYHRYYITNLKRADIEILKKLEYIRD